MRTWREPSHGRRLRVRILEPSSQNGSERLVTTTPSPEAACEAVCAWLRTVAAEADAS